MLLLEVLEYNILYHNMDPTMADYVIKNDALTNKWGDRHVQGHIHRGMSTTRNSKMAFNPRAYGPFCFMLNKSKLLTKYRIIPVDSEQSLAGDNGDKIKPYAHRRDRIARRANPSALHQEELIRAEHIPNIHLYIDHIFYLEGNRYEDFGPEGVNLLNITKQNVKDYASKFGIPFSVKQNPKA